MWIEHFKNLLGDPAEISHKPVEKIINCQQDIKLGQLTKEELDAVPKIIKIIKSAVYD